MTSSDPVMYEDSSVAKNKTPIATSSMLPTRPIGIRDSVDFLPSAVERLSDIMSVSIGPGCTEFALIPS